MRDQILMWLQRTHVDPEFRTLRGIAAFVQVEEGVVLGELEAMEHAGLIWSRVTAGCALYFPTLPSRGGAR